MAKAKSRPADGTRQLGFEAALCAAIHALRDDVARSASRTLGEPRDMPLPRLASGEQRVRDVERLVAAAV